MEPLTRRVGALLLLAAWQMARSVGRTDGYDGQALKQPPMILASRDHLTSEENRQRHVSLKSEVRKAGYGFIEGRHVDEKSLLVVGKRARMVGLC